MGIVANMLASVLRGMIVALTIMTTVVCGATTASAYAPQHSAQVEACAAIDTMLLQTEYKHIPTHGADIPSNTSFFHDDMLIARVDANASSDGTMVAERKKERKKERTAEGILHTM